jgi:integrase
VRSSRSSSGSCVRKFIDQRVYDGALDLPKGRKGKNTTRTVALSPATVRDLAEWITYVRSQAPDAYLFPSETGTPRWPHNLWKRAFQPKLDESRARVGQLPGPATDERQSFQSR